MGQDKDPRKKCHFSRSSSCCEIIGSGKYTLPVPTSTLYTVLSHVVLSIPLKEENLRPKWLPGKMVHVPRNACGISLLSGKTVYGVRRSWTRAVPRYACDMFAVLHARP